MAAVSAGVNALATATLMDLGLAAGNPRHSEQRQFRLARALTVIFGALATLLALGVGLLGTVVEATILIMGLFGGPLLGIFFLGVLSSRANGNGALTGAGAGAVAGALVAFSRYFLPRLISFLWTAFASAGTTFAVGWVSSLLFPAPRPSAQELVFWKPDHRAQP